MASVGGSLFPLLVAFLVLLVEVVAVLDCITPCTVCPVYIKKKIRLSNPIIHGNKTKNTICSYFSRCMNRDQQEILKTQANLNPG
ncbi:hypothetical protein CLU79DRAFT_731405 [Phycomyces nitens]|nr:hypothetical protein CLU79DRAFT_731405 [Phycomyces nitens]